MNLDPDTCVIFQITRTLFRPPSANRLVPRSLAVKQGKTLMPITVRDYTWRETEAEVVLVLPLKGVSPSKADILTTERYIKVHYPPYLFEVYLAAEVVEEQCTVKVGDGAVEFRLLKKETGLWGTLAASDVDQDKQTLAEKRAEAVEVVGKAAVGRAEARAAKKREEDRYAVREQMRLEQEARGRIEGQKQEERDRADRELARWKEEKKAQREKEKAEVAKIAKEKGKSQNRLKKTAKVSSSTAIWDKGDENGVSTPEKKAPPPPREGGNIVVQFTPRVFPTAARESKLVEEQEWLAKQAAARRITQPRSGEDEGDINERNPEFLKDRGVQFFRAKNYEAAVNVFSEAISLNPALPQLFSNRAACHLATDDFEHCVSDCCRALELYYPVVPSNQQSRAKVFARRGSAYAKSGELDLAVQDYEEAVRLVPGDERLQQDLQRLKEATPKS